MKILITGGTGFVGDYVIQNLVKNGHELLILTRNPEKAKQKIQAPASYIKWDPDTTVDLSQYEVDGVIHLAGENIAAKRWSDAQKKVIRDSRVVATNYLVQSLKDKSLKFFISAGAIGIYPLESYGQEFDESTPRASGFLADVCHEWEEASKEIENICRRVILRIGVVLGAEGGALKKMLLPFKMGVGGNIGNGKQYMSWVHVKDVANAIAFCVENEVAGAFNCTSPENVTNSVFTKTLGKVLKKTDDISSTNVCFKVNDGGNVLYCESIVRELHQRDY